MLRRQHVLALLASTLFVGGAILAPAAREPQESLEATSLSGPIASAIDAGVTRGLLGSTQPEPSARAHEIAAGLKEGVPASAPSLTLAQLEDVRAIAAGAVKGAIAASPSTTSDGWDRQALRAMARGYMSGALGELAAAPSSGRAAIDEAVAAGVFGGALGAILADEVKTTSSEIEAYARTLARESFDGLDASASLLSTALGSPGLADITLYASTLARHQLATLPPQLPRSELDAAATFGAGAIDGMVVGVASTFPHGAPAPSREQLVAWWAALARGHEGTPPWGRGDLDLLHAWADAAGASAVRAVGEAGAYVGAQTPTDVLDQVGAWGDALAKGAYANLVEAEPGTRADEARAYADGLAGPGLAYLLTDRDARADRDAVVAWGFGLSGGLADLGGATTGALGLTSAYLSDLSSALAGFPSDVGPGQTAILTAYASGLTTHATSRMEGLAGIVSPDDADLLRAMALGLADGASRMAGGPALSDPRLAEAIGDGYAQGFLSSRNPRDLVGDAESLSAAARSWMANGPPASVSALNAYAQRTARDPYEALMQMGREMGSAPREWAGSKDPLGRSWQGVDDLFWLGEFTNATLAKTVEALVTQGPGLTPEEIERSRGAIVAYSGDVAARAVSLEVASAVDNLTSREMRAHAFRFAGFLLAPLDWGAEGSGGAGAMLESTFENAHAIERFRDVQFASAAIASMKAIGEGIRDHPPAPGAPDEALVAWVDGITDAVLNVPDMSGDLSARLDWLSAMTGAAGPVARDLTESQYEATRDYADAVGRWALGTPGHVPDLEGAEGPLLAWAQATLARGIEALPPVMTEDEKAATVAYLEGVQRAVTALPTPDVASWTLPDVAALSAYVGGVSGGAALVADETNLLLCAYGFPARDCPEEPQEEPEPEPEPPGCDGECPQPEPTCGDRCQLERYGGNLQNWTTALVAGGLEQMGEPDFTPTHTGVQLVAAWATQVLGGHGFCLEHDDPMYECDGPRGPVVDFARARGDDAQAYGRALSGGYLAFIDAEDPTQPGLVHPVTAPLLGWAAGIQNGIAAAHLHPEHFVPGAPSFPGAPEPARDPRDPEFREALRVWSFAMYEALGEALDGAFLPFPDTRGVNDTAIALDHLAGQVIWQGGADAMFDSADAALAYAKGAVSDAALEAFALGLVEGANASLADPARKDLSAMLAWYRGLAEGGVAALAAAGNGTRDEQVPAIAAYAELMAQALQPPAPPTPSAIRSLTAPDEEEDDEDDDGGSSGGGGGGEDPEPPAPSPEEIYLKNVAAHAEGIGAAILAAPLPRGDIEAYGASLLAYAHAVADAAAAMPPVSPDAGFPARLRAWSEAEMRGALANPPTTADRLAPSPDLALALSTIQALAAGVPWNLVPGAPDASGWADAAVRAAGALDCPEGLAGDRCAAIGRALGEGLARALPGEAPPTVAPDVAAPALEDALQAAVAALAAAEPTAAHAAALVAGMVSGALPEGVAVEGAPVYEAVAQQAAALSGALPAGAVQVFAEETTRALLQAPALPPQQTAELVAARVQALASHDPAAVQAEIQRALGRAPGADAPAVAATDGTRTLRGADLEGAKRLDGLVDITITAYSSASTPAATRYELVWRAVDGAPATRAMTGEKGVHRAVLTAAELAALPRAAEVRFSVRETDGARAVEHAPAGGYRFVPDRDAPRATLAAGSVSGASATLSWTGEDGDGHVAGYRVELREGAGAWREWIARTQDARASFSGDAGKTYAFRVVAIDAVGHVGAPSAEATVAIPAGAPANRAPTISIRAPGEGSVFGATLPVALEASDPDDTAPIVRLCLRREGASEDAACPAQGASLSTTLDVSTLPDGRYRLRAIATDGTRTAEATSGVFALDRTPPALRGALVDATHERTILTVGADADAPAVGATIGSQALTLRDDGQGPDARAGDGVWTALVALPAGEHLVVFRASDAHGNEATLARAIVVPAPPAPPAPASGTPGEGTGAPPATPSPPATPAPPPKGTPAPGILALLALAALAALARRRR